MGSLVSLFRSSLSKANDVVSRNRKSTSCPFRLDKQDITRLAPIVVNWLQTASEQLELDDLKKKPLVQLLESAFQRGRYERIYRLATDADGALSIMLTACDISAGANGSDDKLARKWLVGIFCDLVCRSSRFPQCLTLEVQPLDNTQHVSNDYADIYSGAQGGRIVNLQVPKAMQQYGSRILDSRPFRKDVALWRTLPQNEHVHPLLGVSRITVAENTYVSLVFPMAEGERLDQHIRTLISQEASPDFEIVPSILGWIHDLAHGLQHLHSHGIIHGRLRGDTILLTPDGHIQLLGFETTAYEYTDIRGHSASGYHLAFQAPELFRDSGEEPIKPPSFDSDVWAFGCVCVELFNEGNNPYNDLGDAAIKRRVRQGCHPSHTMTMPDEIWAIAERCWDMSPERRPSMQVLVDELTEAQKKPRDFLTSVLMSLASISSNDIERQCILEDLALVARNRVLRKILQYRDSDAEHVLDIFHQILTDCYSGRYNLPVGTRSTLRILMAELASVAESFPQSFCITGTKITAGYLDFIKTGFCEISMGTYQERKVAIKALLIRDFSVDRLYFRAERKLVTESIVWRSLPHERILPFIGVDSQPHMVQPSMISPWMENGNARRYVEQVKGQGKDFRSRVNKLLHQTALAVEFLHSEDIAHGDLRGANVLVDAEGNAVLADFGISVLYGPGSMYRVSSHDGNPSYMSPERANPAWYNEDYPPRSHPPPSLRSDIYSFGCLCIELYACADPYGDANEFVVATKVLGNVPPKRPRKKGHEMSDVLWKVVCQCMERKDLSKRLRAKQVVEARIIDML